MKRTTSPFYARRTFILTLLSFVAVAAIVTFGVSARRANRAAALRSSSQTASAPASKAQDKNPNAPDAAAITASLTDNTATAVAPGGTINYTAVITNNGAASPADDAGSVVYNGTLDANTTLSGTVGVSPVPLNDTYPQTVIGNVQINSANIPYSVVTNDYQGQNGGVVSIGQSGSSANGGQVVMNNTPGPNFGQFTYNPPAGFEGTDTFTYTLTNSVGSTTAATVSMSVSGMVWFINNNSAACTTIAAGCGRITNPFSDLGSFNSLNNGGVGSTNPAVSDNIFIYESATAYNNSITLLNGQRLIGQDSTSTLTTLTGLTPPSGSTAFPAMNSGNGTITKITTGAGNGITLNSAGAAATNVVNGLTVGNTAGVGISGSTFGTLTLADVSIDEPAATRTGQALSLTSGAATATFGTVESSSGTNNVALASVTGNINLGTGALSGATGNALTLSGAGNTATVSYSGTITNTAASAVSVASKTGGTVTLSGLITGSGTGANGGISLLTNTGTIMNFTGGINLSMTGSAPGFTATGGGTVNVTDPNALGTAPDNTIATISGAALNVANTTIGASNLNFRSIASNGAASGIILNSTGASGSLIVTGNGGACTSAGTCTGGAIQNSTGDGISLTTTLSPSFTRMAIPTTGGHGVEGTDVTNFTFQNGFIDNSGTGLAAQVSNLAFNTLNANNVDGVVSIINNTLTNAYFHGVAIENYSGTITSLDISGNTITSSTAGGPAVACPASAPARNPTTCSQGNAIHVIIHGSAGVTSNLNDGTVNNNIITNFPIGGGIIMQGTNADVASPQLTFGIPNDVNNIISITGNRVAGASNANKMNTNAIQVGINGIARGNWEINSNGTIANPITNIAGNVISTSVLGTSTGTVKVNSNRIVANHTPNFGAPFGISAGVGRTFACCTDVATLTIVIDGNNVSGTDGNGIKIRGAEAQGTMNVRISNNTVAAPVATALREGIFVEAGGSTAGTDNDVCLDIVGNTTAGASDGFDTAPGIRLRKQGTSSTVNAFGVEGMGATATPGVEQYVGNGAGKNPGSANGTFGTNGVVLGSATSGFSNCSAAPIAPPDGDLAAVRSAKPRANAFAPASAPAINAPVIESQLPRAENLAALLSLDRASFGSFAKSVTPVPAEANNAKQTGSRRAHHAQFNRTRSIKATKADDQPLLPASGEAVGPINIGTLPAGKSVTITYAATVNAPPMARQATHQGSVTYTNGPGSPLLTNDPDTGPAGDATVTAFNVLMTWNGVTSTDWNTATNWTQPAGGTQYAPGVSNPAVNDVVIPNVGNQPNISATDIGVYSLNIANGRTLTITSPRVLTIGGSPGGDLTLDGIISGGNLNLGTGTHAINNAGGTGSLSSTNVATVLSGSTVTLNNPLQAGALAVNAGGSMNITNRTLSLNGAGAALTVPGGATFTTTGSTVVFNGTAAQTAAGIAYNNLTINNTTGTFVTGVTLTGNATVNGALALTSSDLDTGAFTLTQPNTTASTGVSDVVGTIARTGGPFAPATTLTFGNPNNQITFTAAGTKPSTMTVTMAKAAPATYAAAVQRNYTITPTGGSGYTATLRLHYRDAELNGHDETSIPNFNLRRGPSWNAVAPTARNTAGVDDNWLESNAVTQFSQWTFATLAPTASGGVVTGRIVDDNGAPVEGAVVRLSGAQNRKFITDANGVYRFENVETGGFYNVTPSRVNYDFSPSVISFSQLGETTEAAFGAKATGSDVNPLDTPEYFVRQNYLDFLGREPDEAGFNFWSDQILACGGDTDCVDTKRTHVSAAYFLSIEFQETGGLVDGLYRASFGRRPSYGEFKPDAAAVAPLLVVNSDGWQTALENGKTAFVDAFVQRAAFQTVYGSLSNDAYVDALIANTGVSFTSAERNALVSGLGGGMTRAAVLRQIVEDADFVNAKRNSAFVMMEYFGYLRREPDPAGFDFWLGKLNQFNGNFEQAEMVRSFIVSGEYRDRFPK